MKRHVFFRWLMSIVCIGAVLVVALFCYSYAVYSVALFVANLNQKVKTTATEKAQTDDKTPAASPKNKIDGHSSEVDVHSEAVLIAMIRPAAAVSTGACKCCHER